MYLFEKEVITAEAAGTGHRCQHSRRNRENVKGQELPEVVGSMRCTE